MTREINVGDRVVGTTKHKATDRIGKYGKVVGLRGDGFAVVYDGEYLPKIAYHGEIAHADSTHNGQRLKDLNLNDGDCVMCVKTGAYCTEGVTYSVKITSEGESIISDRGRERGFYAMTLSLFVKVEDSKPVPIGYKGYPRDMDLQEGNTLRGESGCTYTVVDGRVKWDGSISKGALIEDCVGLYTLISRAPQDNSDLFSIEKPFGLLDAETQKRLKAWDGEVEMFNAAGWQTVDRPAWLKSLAYRAVPKKTIQYIDRPCHIGYDGEVTISSGTKGNATMKGKLVNGQPDGKWTIELD